MASKLLADKAKVKNAAASKAKKAGSREAAKANKAGRRAVTRVADIAAMA